MPSDLASSIVHLSRRVASILFYIAGGGIVAMEVWFGFLEFPEAILDNLLMNPALMIFAAAFLAMGAWISPAARWRELGLTIWISAGVGTAIGAMVLRYYYYPETRGFSAGPMAPMTIAPLSAVINLPFVCWIGWVLHGGRARLRRVQELAISWTTGG